MLSKRLTAVADFIDTNIVYDVGCDHALLDIYLDSKGINAIAIDKREDCIKRANENIKKSNSNVKTILNDGLENIKLLHENTVVLSGMGTKNILKIIKNKDIDNLVCQSNKNIYELRKNICNLGYYIVDEKIIYEGNFYIIIKFKKGQKKYSQKEYILGPYLLKNKNEIYNLYLNKMKENIEKNINNYDEDKYESKKIILDMIKEEL